MAISAVEICNTALLELGIPQINELTQGGVVADACNLQYPKSRRTVLEEFEWSFAQRYATLTVVTGASDIPTTAEWSYAYALPNDFVRPVKIDDGVRRPRPDELSSYKIIGHATYRRLLMSNDENAILVYVADVTDESLFSEQFAQAVAMQLAYRLAGPLKGDPQLKAQMLQGYHLALADAMSADSYWEQHDKAPPSIYEDIR